MFVHLLFKFSFLCFQVLDELFHVSLALLCHQGLAHTKRHTMRERGREGRREGGKEEGREGGKEGGREGGREGGGREGRRVYMSIV